MLLDIAAKFPGSLCNIQSRNGGKLSGTGIGYISHFLYRCLFSLWKEMTSVSCD